MSNLVDRTENGIILALVCGLVGLGIWLYFSVKNFSPLDSFNSSIGKANADYTQELNTAIASEPVYTDASGNPIILSDGKPAVQFNLGFDDMLSPIVGDSGNPWNSQHPEWGDSGILLDPSDPEYWRVGNAWASADNGGGQ